MQIDSKPGKGTTVTAQFPKERTARDSIDKPATAVQAGDRRKSGGTAN